MKIEHLAIWADDIELLRAFYMKYFNLSKCTELTCTMAHG